MMPMATANCFLLAGTKFGMDITIACPEEYDLDPAILKLATKNTKSYGGSVEISRDLEKAIKGSHIVYATSWHSIKSYGNPEEEKEKQKSLLSWKITSKLMEKTDGGSFMHPLPIKRNVSVMEEVLDNNCCLAYDQAENCVHAQRAFLMGLMGA
jgi:ornithine carbamoyltransferase